MHFIALEGPEGSGKTTQLQALARALTARGLPVCATREPGGTPIGEQLRAVLLGTANHAMLPQTETLILLAARAQHVAEVISPALARGEFVLCDRYAGATYAYQGYGRGLPLEVLRGLQAFAAGACAPGLTLLFDLPAEVGLARRQATGDVNRLDVAGLDFHRRVRAGYRALAAADPAHWVTLDATQPVAEVTAQALRILTSRLELPVAGSE
ncbi:MAG: dTMP kinase [Thermomicrobiales bacterium]|nr:dTMP kinase [Thermomicrobiales bacterium]